MRFTTDFVCLGFGGGGGGDKNGQNIFNGIIVKVNRMARFILSCSCYTLHLLTIIIKNNYS